MITTTAVKLIDAALKTIGVLASGETANPNDAQDAFLRLNSLIDSWGLQRNTIYAVTRSEHTLTADQNTYTIGDSGGADFVQQRPIWIDNAGLILPGTDPAIEINVPALTDDAYAAMRIKELTNPLIVSYYYNTTSPLGTIFVWPTPTQELTFVLYWPTAVTQFTTLTTSVKLPPGYERALRLNLAVELAPEFGRPLDPLVFQQANESLADLKRANLELTDLMLDSGLTSDQRRPYNIYTDS